MPEMNFSHLLRGRIVADETPPKALFPTQYPGVITRQQFATAPWNKDVPGIRYTFVPRRWPDAVIEEDRLDAEGNEIDLESRSISAFYSLEDDRRWILLRLWKSCGLDGLDQEAANAEMVGKEVLADVGTYTDKRDGAIRNQINSMVGTD
jgi:hypothetical protein